MIERSNQRRLDAVARTYLDREGPVSRLVVVAGENVVSTRAACHALQRAATTMGVPTVMLEAENDVLDVELAHDRTPPLVVYHHGEVQEDHLGRLRPPDGTSVDLLLWDLPTRAKLGMRSLYLLGLWTWAMQPRQTRCLLPPAESASARAASIGDPTLGAMRDRLRAGLQTVGAERPAELLQRPASWNDGRTEQLLVQVLQSLLAAVARRASAPGPVEKVASAGSRWLTSALFALLTVFAFDAVALARAQSVTVEIRGLDLSAPTAIASDGSRVLGGAHHLLRLAPGVGSDLAEGGVVVSTDRSELSATMDGRPVAFDDVERIIEGTLVLHAPEFTLEVRHGRVRAGPDGIVVLPELSGPPLPGRQGIFVTGVMLVVILLLVWRASAVRRRLDEPYVSLRRRKRDLEG